MVNTKPDSKQITHDDTGGHFDASDVHGVLEELGAASGGVFNLKAAGADITGVVAADSIWADAVASGKPIYAPDGIYRFATSKTLSTDMTVFGDRKPHDDVLGGPGEGTTFLFDGVEGFQVNDTVEHRNITLKRFQIRQSGNWSGNVFTGLFLSNVSYSLFEDIECRYFLYGIFLRRTDPGGGFLGTYFNKFVRCGGFGCKYGITEQDNGATPNANTYINSHIEDNGQRSGGYGIRLDSVGAEVRGLYAGLPFHSAALVLGSTCLNVLATNIYGESPTMTQVILDETATGRDNVVIGVHGDGTPILVSRDFSTSNTVYINAGSESTVRAERTVTLNTTPAAVGAGSYDYTTVTVPGITPSDSARCIVPSGWPSSLNRGAVICNTGNVRVPYFNGTGGSLTPSAGDYVIKWKQEG